MKFAAGYAEVVFTQKSTIEDAQSFYAGIKSLVREAGRDPDRVKVLPGLMPIVAETETEAARIAHELSEYADFEHLRNDLEKHLADLAGLPDFTLEDLALDEPIPQERLIEPSAVQGFQSRYAVFHSLACEGKSLRDSLRVLAGGRGHPVVVGTPEQVADVMETWFTQGACDGFQLVSPHYFDGLDAITEQLIPELRARGLFRTEYPGTTLRESYGLTRPAGRPTTPIGEPKADVTWA
jgi:alkanesulfonate monooxygenase SsuD/methylene tetrahydromethanopterin reductase-like flavin-dependent oxidoreductase (luciferase family)